MAVYTAVAAGGNWNAAATWGGAGFPIAGDTANITAVMTATVTVNVASACAILNLTGNGGTLAFGNFNITITGNITLGGTITAGTGGIVSTSTATLTSGGVTFPGIFSITGNTTKTITGNWINTGLVTNGGVTTLTPTAAETFRCNGGLTKTSAISGNVKIIIGGGTVSGAGAIYTDLEFVADSTISGTWGYGTKTMTYTAGTITTAGSVISNVGAATFDTDRGATQITFDTFTLAAGTITLASDFNCVTLNQFSISPLFTGNFDIYCSNLVSYCYSPSRSFTWTAGRYLYISTSMNITAISGVSLTFNSGTAGTRNYLNYSGTYANCNIVRTNFTDTDATGSAVTVYEWAGGTLNNTLGITQVDGSNIGGTTSNVFGWI